MNVHALKVDSVISIVYKRGRVQWDEQGRQSDMTNSEGVSVNVPGEVNLQREVA